MLLRRSCLETVGWFDEDEDLVAVEDFDLWLRLAARYSIHCMPQKVAAVRRHAESLSLDSITMRERIFTLFKKMKTLHPRLIEEHRQAFHEAYARNHAALCLAYGRRLKPLASLRHGAAAMGHLPFCSGGGVAAFVHWWRNRVNRRPARP